MVTSTSGNICVIPTDNFIMPLYNLIVLENATIQSQHVHYNSIICGSLYGSGSPVLSQLWDETNTPQEVYSVEINGRINTDFMVQHGSLGVSILSPSRNLVHSSTNLQEYTIDGKTVTMLDYNLGARAEENSTISTKCATIPDNVRNLSNILCGLPTTAGNFAGSPPNQANSYRFHVNTTDNNGLAVFNLSPNELFGNSNIGDVTLTATDPNLQLVVINVRDTTINYSFGPNVNFQGPFPNNMDMNAHVIWNFCDATYINFIRNMKGAILAPKALVEFSVQIDGALAAKSILQNAELHKPLLVLPPCIA